MLYISATTRTYYDMLSRFEGSVWLALCCAEIWAMALAAVLCTLSHAVRSSPTLLPESAAFRELVRSSSADEAPRARSMTGGGYRLLASANFGELVLGCVEAKCFK